MKFSTKIRYGIRAMTTIASENSGNGVLQKEIAENQLISIKYLDQIISALKAAELIVNVRGKKSGYILTKDPSEIKMLDIYSAFEGGIYVIDCLNDSVKCDFQDRCKSLVFWENLNKLIHNYFSTVTLQDVLSGKIPEEITFI